MPSQAPVRKRKTLTAEDHETIQRKCNINPDSGEDYSTVFQKGKAKGIWSIHVFSRQPTQGEINKYEDTASKVQFKGTRAYIEGSQINAGVNLYNALISRAYDVLVGLREYPVLTREEAIARVPPLIKREAIRDLVGQVFAASRMEEIEGAEEDEPTDDDAEGHTDAPDGSGTLS